MTPLTKYALRFGAAASAAALAVATGLPALAHEDHEHEGEDDDAHLHVYFNLVDTDETVDALEYGGQEAYVAVDGASAARGDTVEITVDFTAMPDVLEVLPVDEDRCEFGDDVLRCFDDGTSNSSGYFALAIALGPSGRPGDIAEYTVTGIANDGELADTWDGRISVSEDYADWDGPDADGPGAEFDRERFELLTFTLDGAVAGAMLDTAPQIRVTREHSLDDHAGTLITFSDASDFDSETSQGSSSAAAVADYDNCRSHDGGVRCVVPTVLEAGTTYTVSPRTPVVYVVAEDEVRHRGVYQVFDVNTAALAEMFEGGVAPSGADNLELVAVAEAEIGADEDFDAENGFIAFSSEGAGGRASTGAGTVVILGAAVAAAAAGAGALILIRRRKAAQAP